MNQSRVTNGPAPSDLKSELEELERRLRADLGAGGAFLRREGLRLLDSGGKRLRPAMTIAAGHLGVYDRERVLPVAASVELIHMATLVHDDVIDAAALRRGTATTYARYGAHTAVYTGDWLLVKALHALSALGKSVGADPGDTASKSRSSIPEQLVAGLEALCTGEVDQYLGRGRIPGLRAYLTRIEKKTAALFSVACAAGAAASGQDEPVVAECTAFGRAFGIAFQIQDDLLDVGSSAGVLGKPVSHDLLQGIATLPFLLAAKSDAGFRRRLEAFFQEAGAARPEGLAMRPGLRPSSGPLAAAVRSLVAEMVALGGVRDAQALARRYQDEAKEHLSMLPPSSGRDMLEDLARL